jgi:hypothetical protein
MTKTTKINFNELFNFKLPYYNQCCSGNLINIEIWLQACRLDSRDTSLSHSAFSGTVKLSSITAVLPRGFPLPWQ